MMKNILSFLLFLAALTNTAYAADGYTINIQYSDVANQGVYLAHYYGTPLPTIFKVDSTVLDGKGKATLKSDNKIVGGLYLIVLPEKSVYFEVLLNNGDKLDITAKADGLPLELKYKSSAENNRFVEYSSFLSEVGTKHQELMEKLKTAKTSKDSTAVQEEMQKLGNSVKKYRKDYVKQYPKTLLSNIFSALEVPEVPSSIKNKDDQFWYYKRHYWDGVDLTDDRLTYTPLLDNKLSEYFGQLVAPVADTFNAEADILLEKARPSKEMFKYILNWLTTYVQKSDVMGMDAVFVHLVENYHMKGEAFWLSQGTLQKYIDRARSIAPNVVGNVAPEIKMKGMDGKDYSLLGTDAKYTLLVFWSPDCGHCREVIPKVDSLYKAAKLKEKGMKIYGFNVDRDMPVEQWQKVIKEFELNDWIHVNDPDGTSRYRSNYDVYGTPSIYLMDDKKIIRGKKLDHTNILQVIDIIKSKTDK
ncbi:MAG: DUF5106 domain-containing protein [Chitinophagales bacterium]|nr:DUF5106 domain-containing protein [Chitinophagaceae bacterium]MCB9066044.1 DUF5106 domain-containing protein [Chitinophagales bacterium]